MTTRSKLVKHLRKLAAETGRPIGSLYGTVYKEIGRRSGINLFATAKYETEQQKKKIKPLDVADERGLTAEMLEIAMNLGDYEAPRSTVRRRRAQPEQLGRLMTMGGETIDRETGEVID